jgi:2-polyprenyl-3-methyl-5-hydroxy-6-metoxy-1,4-benzoquinol methylase
MNIKKLKRGVEVHYENALNAINPKNPADINLGVGVAWAYFDDPKHLVFTLSRYKFASKVFSGRKNLLEVGCGDGFASRILLQSVDRVVGIDVDEKFILDGKLRYSEKWPIDFRIHDIVQDGPIEENFDAVLCLDVLEHIEKTDHEQFIGNITSSMISTGVLVIGMPSIESQPYASPQSKLGHISCLTQNEFKDSLEKYFSNVFMFSMNDEIIHTGYSRMSHYNLALCCQKIN